MKKKKESKPFEQRIYSVELETRESEDKTTGTITGRPVVYNSRTNIGGFDEIIMPGALAKTNLDDVRFCLNHDTSFVYARSRRNNPNSTMRLLPDMEGLAIEADFAIEESARAKDLYTAILRRDIDKMSFMFSIEDEEWEGLDTDHPVRYIKSIGTIVEVSAVTFPAYDSTSIDARSQETLENARLALENARDKREKTLENVGSLDLEKAKFNFLSKL